MALRTRPTQVLQKKGATPPPAAVMVPEEDDADISEYDTAGRYVLAEEPHLTPSLLAILSSGCYGSTLITKHPLPHFSFLKLPCSHHPLTP